MSDNYKLAELEERIKSLEEFAEKFGLPENIRKTEPKVIIRKSGGTWVKRENGIDYLCMNPSDVVEEDDILNELSGIMKWKPINEIEITDEIAHMHPLVESGITGNIVPLLAVRDSAYSCGEIVKGRFYITEEINVGPITSATCRLATVEDL